MRINKSKELSIINIVWCKCIHFVKFALQCKVVIISVGLFIERNILPPPINEDPLHNICLVKIFLLISKNFHTISFYYFKVLAQLQAVGVSVLGFSHNLGKPDKVTGFVESEIVTHLRNVFTNLLNLVHALDIRKL